MQIARRQMVALEKSGVPLIAPFVRVVATVELFAIGPMVRGYRVRGALVVWVTKFVQIVSVMVVATSVLALVPGFATTAVNRRTLRRKCVVSVLSMHFRSHDV